MDEEKLAHALHEAANWISEQRFFAAARALDEAAVAVEAQPAHEHEHYWLHSSYGPTRCAQCRAIKFDDVIYWPEEQT